MSSLLDIDFLSMLVKYSRHYGPAVCKQLESQRFSVACDGKYPSILLWFEALAAVSTIHA